MFFLRNFTACVGDYEVTYNPKKKQIIYEEITLLCFPEK